MKLISNFIIIVSIFLLTSCADKKSPPLVGTRINVLHYDLLKSQSANKTPITIPAQTNLLEWKTSDTDQFIDLPFNISLAQDLKLSKVFSASKFRPNAGDSSLMIIGDVLYSYTKETLAAYKISTNKNIWSAQVIFGSERNDVLSGSFVYDKGIIYLASGGRDFVAFNAETGKELWRYRAHNVLRYVASIKNNLLYITSIDNTLSCLSLDGKLLWRYDAPAYSLTNNHIYTSNLIYEDKVVTITTAGDLIALNRTTGEELTQVNLATTSIIGDGSLTKGPVYSPLLDKSNLYTLTGEDDLIKIDLAIPEIAWRQNFPGAQSFWLTEDFTYILIASNQLLAIENKKGELLWAVDLPKDLKKKKLRTFYGPIMAGNQLIITANNGEFFMYSPYDGKLIASYANNFLTNRMPMIVDNKAYFISTKGKIAVWQ